MSDDRSGWQPEDREQEAVELAERTLLSEREALVVLCKRDGLTHKQTANLLGVAKGTVDSHSSRASEKVRAARRTLAEFDDLADD